METKDKEKTAFMSPIGLLQFTVMPFGLCRAPATFQRLMDQVLRGLENNVGVYVDDIVIFSNTWDEHIRHLQEVFTRLMNANLTIRLKKCKFAMNECVYLGHVIGKEELSQKNRK